MFFGLFSSSSSLKTYTVEVRENGVLTQTLSVDAENGFEAVDKVYDSLPKPRGLRNIKCLNCISF